MENINNLKKNSNNFNNNSSPPNYQISGIQPNYTYNGVQNLNFDTSYISQSGYENNKLLTKGVNDQQQFVNNYNNYKPHTTFSQYNGHDEQNSSYLENLRDHSQFNIERNFESNKPITRMLDTKNKDNTIYANLNENLMKESIMEVRLNIDSMDRDVRQYPDPFNYVVTFGPIVNSGINSTLSRSSLKDDLKKANKINKNPSISNNKQICNTENEIIFTNNPNYIINYTDRLKRSFNPYITRDFDNIKFIRLDNVVLPRFDCLKLNEDWDFCRDINFTDNKHYIKDDYERIKKQIILNNRYIPDDNLTCSLFTDRFIQIYIKEIENNYNLGTNPILTKAFTVFPDKQVGILYWRGNPYYAVKTYKDSLLGVINRLSIQFYNSWGQPITLNTTKINPEKDILLATDLINPSLIDINDIDTDAKLNYIISKFTDIIKCVVFINSTINKKIPFYISDTTIMKDFDTNCCPNFSTIILNNSDFIVSNIYTELNDFVTTNGFISFPKINKNNKKEFITIDNYIKNIIWYNDKLQFKKQILFNLETLINNYKSFVFKSLDRLKVELLELPINPYFQNHLTFVMGMYTNELNTKIDFYQ